MPRCRDAGLGPGPGPGKVLNLIKLQSYQSFCAAALGRTPRIALAAAAQAQAVPGGAVQHDAEQHAAWRLVHIHCS